MKFFYSNKFIFFILFICIIVLRVVYSIYTFNFKYVSNENRYIEAKILSKYSESEKYISYTAKLKYSGIFSDKFILYVPKEKEYLNSKSIISFYSKISKNEFYNNYNEFNYELYLNSNNIVGSIFVNDYDILKLEKSNNSYKQEFFDYLDNNLSCDTSNLIKAIICGDKNGLTDDLKEKFDTIGFSHILVVSGTAIYFLKGFVSKLFKKNKSFFEFVIISVYVMFCNFNISLTRAYIMYLGNFIKNIFNLRFNSYTIIYISIIIFILYNPYIIFNYSFWYTYLAVISIKMLYPRINSKLYVVLLNIFKVKHEKYIKKQKIFKIIKYLINNIALTTAVQIMLFPISLFTGSKIFLLSIFSNVIINILVSLEYIFGFIFILIFKFPIISNVFFLCLKGVTNIIIKITEIFNYLDFFNIKFNKISSISMICMYILILTWNFGYILKFRIKYLLKNRKNVNYIYYLFILLLIVIILIDFIFIYCLDFVYFFNIGQGNMAITKSDDVIIVSDIGSSSTDVKYILLNFLAAYNITELDYVFLSHMHSDHINGLLDLQQELQKKEIIIKNVCYTYINDEVKEFCKKHNINLIQLQKEDELIINNKIHVDVISPSLKEYIISSDKQNSNSLVYSININNQKFLYMGDATKETENMLIKSKSVKEYFCFQVGHHGSSTSTSEEFLNDFKFKYAVISSEKSMYGHPTDEVVVKLKKNNIKTIILENTGGISFFI